MKHLVDPPIDPRHAKQDIWPRAIDMRKRQGADNALDGQLRFALSKIWIDEDVTSKQTCLAEARNDRLDALGPDRGGKIRIMEGALVTKIDISMTAGGDWPALVVKHQDFALPREAVRRRRQCFVNFSSGFEPDAIPE